LTAEGGSLYLSKNSNPREGKKMVRINLLPERLEAAIWGTLEKAAWIFWFLLPFAFFLWANLAVNSK